VYRAMDKSSLKDSSYFPSDGSPRFPCHVLGTTRTAGKNLKDRSDGLRFHPSLYVPHSTRAPLNIPHCGLAIRAIAT